MLSPAFFPGLGTAGSAVALAVVPLTHALGGRLLFGRAAWTPRATFLRGGLSFVALQAAAWTLYGLSAALALRGVASLAALLGVAAAAAAAHRQLSPGVLLGAGACARQGTERARRDAHGRRWGEGQRRRSASGASHPSPSRRLSPPPLGSLSRRRDARARRRAQRCAAAR